MKVLVKILRMNHSTKGDYAGYNLNYHVPPHLAPYMAPELIVRVPVGRYDDLHFARVLAVHDAPTLAIKAVHRICDRSEQATYGGVASTPDDDYNT